MLLACGNVVDDCIHDDIHAKLLAAANHIFELLLAKESPSRSPA